MPTKTNPALSENQPRIFLSYAREDEDFARDLRQKLTAHGFSLWQDRTQMEGMKKWWAQIEEALKTIECMVLVVTKAALRSKVDPKERMAARARRWERSYTSIREQRIGFHQNAPGG